MVRKLRVLIIGAVVFGALAAASYAIAGALDKGPKPTKVPDSKHFRAHLTSYQEVPSLSTTGVGDFEATLVNDTTLHYVFQFANLEGGASLFAHVHFGQRATSGGVSFFLCGGGGKPACPNVSGRVEGDVTPADVVGPAAQGIAPGQFDEIIKAMRLGYAYANIHTTTYPGGEIRGQINSHTGEKHDK